MQGSGRISIHLPMGEATPPSPLPFPVKFRVVSLDKDLTPSNQKVRAGLGRGEVPRAPCTVPAGRGRGVGVTFPLGNAALASPARGAAPGAGMPCAAQGCSRVGKEKAEGTCDTGMCPRQLPARDAALGSGKQGMRC